MLSKTTVLGIGAAGLAGALFWIAFSGPGEPPAPTVDRSRGDPGANELPARGPDGAVEAAASRAAADRSVSGAQVASVGDEPTSDAEAWIEGLVLDVDGQPVPRVPLVISPRPAGAVDELESDGAGRFRLPGAGVQGLSQVSSRRADLVDVLVAQLDPGDTSAELVVAPAISLGGRVVDEAGEPVPGASVVIEAGELFRTELPIALDSGRLGRWSAVADEGGRFLIERAPAVAGATLAASLGEELRSDSVPAPRYSDYELVLELRLPTPLGELVRGRVLDANGTPAAGARVACGYAGARCDELGHFALERARMASDRPLRAALEGFLPATMAARSDGWPDEVVLHLGGPALAIEGRVLDHDGTPLASREVWVEDPTVFGPVQGMHSHVEAVLVGDRGSTSCRTDESGRFRLEGLLERSYDLSAFDIPTLRRARSEGVLAGSSGIELRLPPPEAGTALAGTVVDGSGEPLAGVAVSAGLVTKRFDWGEKLSPSSSEAYGPQAVTDAEGAFRIEAAPSDIDRVSLDGDATLPTKLDLDPEMPREALRLVAPGRRMLQVEVIGILADATSFSVLDEGGEALALYSFRGRGRTSSTAWQLHDGRSPVLAVADTARTLVLARGMDELMREPLELEREDVNLVRVE